MGSRDYSALRAEFSENGCVRVPELLDKETLEHCRACFDWTLAHPSKIGRNYFEEKGGGFYDDASGTKESLPVYRALLEARPIFAQACQELWGGPEKSKNVWFFDHEVFRKSKGIGRGTPFHQDTGVIPFRGEHMAVVWIPFSDVPKENSLEIVLKSHRGPLYNHPRVFAVVRGDGGQDTDTEPMHSEEEQRAAGLKELLTPMPDVLATRESWDLCSWAVSAGDVVVFHPHALHGGAPVSANFPERNSLVLRFFGDDCFYRGYPPSQETSKPYREVKEGDHFSRCRNGEYLRVLQEQGYPGTPPEESARTAARL